MHIEIRKLTPALVEDYIHFLIQHRTIKSGIMSNVTVFFGAVMIVQEKIFIRKRHEGIMPPRV